MIDVAHTGEASELSSGSWSTPFDTWRASVSSTAHGSELLQTAMLQMLDGFVVGAIVTDASKRVLCCNELAASVLRRGDTLMLSHGTLRATHPRTERELQRLIAAAAAAVNSVEGSFLGVGSHQANPLVVVVRPIRSAKGEASGSALVLIRDPASKAGLAIDGIKLLYGLTPAEARLVAALLQGRCLNAHARTSRITRNTAKTQLQAVFQKTGYARQSELISGILRDPLVHLSGSCVAP